MKTLSKTFSVKAQKEIKKAFEKATTLQASELVEHSLCVQYMEEVFSSKKNKTYLLIYAVDKGIPLTQEEIENGKTPFEHRKIKLFCGASTALAKEMRMNDVYSTDVIIKSNENDKGTFYTLE